MLEKHIEAHLMKRVKESGGIAYKFTSPQRRSVPDRLVLRNGDQKAIALIKGYAPAISDAQALSLAQNILKEYAHFVETKATGAKPTEGQLREHTRLRGLGFTVLVIDAKEEVDAKYGA